MKLTTKQAKPITKLVFPDYRGRTYRLEFAETVTFWDTNWGGGTRNSYAAVRADGQSACLSVPAPWVNPVEGQTIKLPPHVLMVKHTIFCGKDMGITISAHPSYAPKWLTA